MGLRGISTWYCWATCVWSSGPPQSGAAVRQGRLVNLVDLFGGRWLTVGLRAVVLAGLAAWFARIELGLALGEGSGLALAGAGRLAELAAQALVLGLQIVEASLQGLAAGTRDGLHTPLYAGHGPQLRCLGARAGISLSCTR